MDRDSRVNTKAPSPLHPGAVTAGVIGLLMALPPAAQALGVSAPQTRSYLGQQLDLVFPVSLAPGETLTAECVRAEVMAGDSRIPPSFVTITLEGPNESNVRAVRIGSTSPINEPIVSVSLTLSCPIRMTRQYVALIDPQTSAVANAAPSALPDAPTQEVESQKYSPALRAALGTSESKPEQLLDKPPVVPTVTSRPPAARPPAPARPASQQPIATASSGGEGAPAEKPRKTSKKRPIKPIEAQTASAGTGGTAASAPVSRLRLDAPEPVNATSPVASASAPARSASEVADAALSAIAASEAMQSRLTALEAGINKMQSENQAQQARMAQLQAQLNAAQADRGNGTLTWMLGLMVLGLGGFSVFQWRRHEQQRAEWWAAADAARTTDRTAAATVNYAPTRAPLAADVGNSTWQAPMTSPAPLVDAQISALADLDAGAPTLPGAPVGYHDTTTLSLADTAPIPFMDSQMKPMDMKLAAPADPSGPVVTVEELLDMEQQVEFFMVLGQTDAAIDLLRGRVDTGTSSALPYLKLLEVYQGLGDEEAFAELSGRFARRFNALPPAWGGMAGDGLGLETTPGALRQVQAVWTDPAASMEVLQKLLVHGEQGENGTAQAFDLPAYRDLLLLYSVARDLSEQEVRGNEIDVFLPLDSSNPMMATQPWQRPGGPAPASSVAVDISLDPLEPPRG